MAANVSLIIPDNRECRLTLDNVNLHGYEKPAITIGSNCSVIINLVGDNALTFDGIRVPETSELTIIGSGNLILESNHTNRVGIGGTSEQTYGNITLAACGTIRVLKSSNISVGIGGGYNYRSSTIRIISGEVIVESSGYTTVGIGCISGNAIVEIASCDLHVFSEATKSVCIGSIMGLAKIKSSGNLDIKSEGKYSAAIGVLDESKGSISFCGGNIVMHFNSHNGTAIGCLSGNIDIQITDGEISIYGEGTDILGIGNQTGFGNIMIQGGVIAARLFAANAVPIGNIQRNVIIDGGNIQCDFPKDFIPVNSYGPLLVAHIITATDEFLQKIETVSYTYIYKANYSGQYPYIKVYLPENALMNN
jgi:hypothetical protein